MFIQFIQILVIALNETPYKSYPPAFDSG